MNVAKMTKSQKNADYAMQAPHESQIGPNAGTPLDSIP